MAKDQCPYCKHLECIPDVVIAHTMNYGSRYHYVKCLHCKKVIHVGLKRIVKLEAIYKTERKEADW